MVETYGGIRYMYFIFHTVLTKAMIYAYEYLDFTVWVENWM
jgi:hypothetical protein